MSCRCCSESSGMFRVPATLYWLPSDRTWFPPGANHHLRTPSSAGFNQHYPLHRTVSMAVSFSKAFDTVNHTRFLTDIHHTTMPHNAIRWLTTYLRGRTAAFKYNKLSSKSYPLRTGVPQWSVLSPLLFNLYVSSYPQTVQLSISYADDFTASVTAGSTSLAAHAADVSRWAGLRTEIHRYPFQLPNSGAE